MTDKARSAYFSIVSALVLVLSVAAFSDNLFTNVAQPSNSDPKFVIHGLFGLAWSVLLVVQANLVRLRNVKLHRKLGIATFVVAIGVTLSTLYIFVVVWKGWEQMAIQVRANRLFLVGFATCLVLAWRWRAHSDWHKRLIFIGTFFMLGPVLSRAYDPVVVSWMEPLFPALTARIGEVGHITSFCGVWIGFFVSLAHHDWLSLRRIHPATMAGFAWFVLTWLVSAFT
ncbi:MAG: hypothetical protein ABI650_09370 [Dokdonella sp.]